jgi:hypothetical protein
VCDTERSQKLTIDRHENLPVRHRRFDTVATEQFRQNVGVIQVADVRLDRQSYGISYGMRISETRFVVPFANPSYPGFGR